MRRYLGKLRTRDLGALAWAVGFVVALGTLGSIIGRWWWLVPSSSFGTTGEWAAGAAAVAALLGISAQIEAARRLQLDDQQVGKRGRWAIRCLEVARELRLSCLYLLEDPNQGLVLRRSVEDWLTVASQIERSISEVQLLGASVVGMNLLALQTASGEWLSLSGVADRRSPIVGVVDAANKLVAALEAVAAAAEG